MNAVALNLSS